MVSLSIYVLILLSYTDKIKSAHFCSVGCAM